MSKALVILSGGQDSTTCLFWAKKNYDEVCAITFDYGQRHRVELEAACRVATLAGVCHEIIHVMGCLRSTSPLLSAKNLKQYEDYASMISEVGERVEATFVPMRNLFFIVTAANYAISTGCKGIVLGVSEADSANYPDCTSDFIRVAEAALNVAILGMPEENGNKELILITPLINLSKKDTVLLAHSMPDCWEALEYTHTSYAGEYPPLDNNHANILRAKGFEDAGLPDPLIMRAYREGLIDLPDTPNYKNLQFELNFKD